MDRSVNLRKVSAFLAFAFMISWIIAFSLYTLEVGLDTLTGSLLVALMMWGPAISGFLVLLFWTEKGLLSQLKRYFGLSESRFSKVWAVLAWLTPLVLLFIMLGIGVLLLGLNFTAGTVEMLIPIGIGLLAGITINALGAFGEEFGWRAILLDELSALGFWRASAAIGIIWGLWHSPLIFWGFYFPGKPVLGVVVMIAFTTAFSPALVYFTARSKSILAPSFLHGSFNSLVPLAFVFISGADELLIGPTGLVGILAVLLLVLFCIIHDSFIADERVTNKSSFSIWPQGPWKSPFKERRCTR